MQTSVTGTRQQSLFFVALLGYVCLDPFFLSLGAVCESRGGRPGLPVPNKPDGFCGRKATLKRKRTLLFNDSVVSIDSYERLARG